MTFKYVRREQKIAERRALIGARYTKGESINSIAINLGLATCTVSKDLKAIRESWLESALRDFDTAKSEELAKIDEVERHYWDGWARSKLDKETRSTRGRGKGVTTSTKEEGQAGNPAFLEGVLKCIERRCRILGLDAPTKTMSLNIPYESLTDDQITALAAGEDPSKVLGERMRVIDAAPLLSAKDAE